MNFMNDKVPEIIDGFTHTEYLTVFTAIIFGYVGAEYFVLTIVSSFVYDDIGNVFIQNVIRGFGVALAIAAAFFNRRVWLHIIFLVIGYFSLIRFFLALPT